MTIFITKDKKVIPITNSKSPLSSNDLDFGSHISSETGKRNDFGFTKPEQLKVGTVGINTVNTVNASQLLKQKEIGLADLEKTIETRVDSRVDPEYALIIANAYDDLKHNPNDPEVKRAYDAFIRETIDQAKILQFNGMKFDSKGTQNNCARNGIDCGEDGNYSNAQELIKDIENNNHIFYRKSDQDYIGVEDHPMFRMTDFKNVDGENMRANDIFRAVHDINGHANGRVAFNPEGEIKAYLEHKKFYSAEGIKALFTETQGQGSWVNFNKNSGIENRHFQKTGELDRIKFPPQKAIVFPEGIIF